MGKSVVNEGWFDYKASSHPCQDCISLDDNDGIGFVMSAFAHLKDKYVRLTVEEIEPPPSCRRATASEK